MIDALQSAAALAYSSDAPTFFRHSRWGYAFLNACHILGVGLLVGGILPLDLRLLGAWPKIPLGTLTRVLVPTAATGLALAVITGTLLFSVRAPEYAELSVFRLKMMLVATGAISALAMHLRHGLWLESATRRHMALAGLVSMACWIGALAAGRLIAFASG